MPPDLGLNSKMRNFLYPVEKVKKCSLCESASFRVVDEQISMCQCKNCGYLFINPRPTQKAIADYYSKCANYDFWLSAEEGFDQLSDRRYQIVKKMRHKGRLLDVGAGIGQFLKHAKKSFEIDGTELSENAVKIAKNKFGIELKQDRLEELKLDKKYDVITMFHVLEHVHNPGQTLKTCRELLDNGGLLVIAVPNDVRAFMKLPLKRLLRFLRLGHFKNYGKFGMPALNLEDGFGEIHLSQFTAPVLSKHLLRNGFEIIKNSLDPYFADNKPAHWLKYFLFLTIKKLTNCNLYDTIFIVARKKEI